MSRNVTTAFFTLLLLIYLVMGPQSHSWGQEWAGNVVTDPAIGRRCDALAKKRSQKVELKQKLMALLKRNTHLQKIAPRQKKSVRKRLEVNNYELSHELELTRLVIEQVEESIIRKGCPGIAL